MAVRQALERRSAYVRVGLDLTDGLWHAAAKWRPVGDGVTQYHNLLTSRNLMRLLLLRTVADRGSSFQSATGPTHQLNICRFRAGDAS